MYTLDARITVSTAKAVRFLSVLLALAFFFTMFGLVSASAASDAASAIENGVDLATEKIYDIMTSVVPGLAVVCFGWAAFKVLAGGQRGMEEAKEKMIRIVAVLAVVWLAPLIISQISGWFSGQGKADIW